MIGEVEEGVYIYERKKGERIPPITSMLLPLKSLLQQGQEARWRYNGHVLRECWNEDASVLEESRMIV